MGIWLGGRAGEVSPWLHHPLGRQRQAEHDRERPSAHEAPQLILRHGKPAGVVIDWALFQARRTLLLPGFDAWLDELGDINQREGEFDVLPRQDRSEIGLGLA